MRDCVCVCVINYIKKMDEIFPSFSQFRFVISLSTVHNQLVVITSHMATINYRFYSIFFCNGARHFNTNFRFYILKFHFSPSRSHTDTLWNVERWKCFVAILLFCPRTFSNVHTITYNLISMLNDDINWVFIHFEIQSS